MSEISKEKIEIIKNINTDVDEVFRDFGQLLDLKAKLELECPTSYCEGFRDGVRALQLRYLNRKNNVTR